MEIVKKMPSSRDQAYVYILIGKGCHCMDVKVGVATGEFKTEYFEVVSLILTIMFSIRTDIYS